MRTESPVGGGPSTSGSPLPPRSDYIADQMTSKLPRDVDAAMVMAGLGRVAAGYSESTNGRHVADFDERDSARVEAMQRFTHIKSAVMPERHSFVQKALKRKIEHRMESVAPSYHRQSPEATLVRESAEAGQGSMLKAIESERGYFGSVKRCRLSEFEANKTEDDVGRFIRTGQPCRSSDEVYPNLAYIEVTPYANVKSEDSSSESGCSNGCRISRFSVDDSELARRHSARVDRTRQIERYSPIMEQDLKLPVPLPVAANSRSLPLHLRKLYENPAVDVLPKANADVGATGLATFIGSASKNRVIHGNDFRHIPPQPSRCIASSDREHQRYRDGQVHPMNLDNMKKRDNLSAYYSLGRQHASTLTSPARAPVMNGHKTSSKVSQHVESRMLYVPGNSENMKYYSSIRPKCFADENKKVQVDSRTETKVKSGEFGTLRTLQNFYNKLGPKASSPEKTAFRGRLGSITNGRPQPVYQPVSGTDEHSNRYKSYADNDQGEDIAIDLSVHSRRMPSNLEETCGGQIARYELLKLGHGVRRKSRSCCSSPSMVLDLATKASSEQYKPVLDQVSDMKMKKVVANSQRWLGANASSLPSSPFIYHNDQIKLETICSSPEKYWSEQKEDYGDKQAAAKADSRLPLKKRRLLDVGSPSNDAAFASPSPQAEISAYAEQNLSAVKRECIADHRETAVRRDSPTLISAIVHGDEDGDLPLHNAIAQGNLDLVERILDIMYRLEMSLDCYNSIGQTPLHIAVSTDQPAVVRRLLKDGASPNIVDRNGLTSIHYAAKLASSKSLDCLLEHSTVRPDLDAITYLGQTALHLAVQSNNVQAVMILIDNGAKIDTCDGSNGRTPLHYAFEQNNLTMARILLANGATPILPSYSTPVPFTQRCRTDVSRLHDVYVAADVKG